MAASDPMSGLRPLEGRGFPLSLASFRHSLSNARRAIAVVGTAYALSAGVGAAMVHAGDAYALGMRDRIVGAAKSGTILTQHSPILSALLDAGGNMLSGLVTSLLSLGIVLPFPLVFYRGWIGGIVSIDGHHVSRLAHLDSAAYYLSTLILQLLASSLAVGAGLHVGLANLSAPSDRLPSLLGLPRAAVSDAARIWLIALPLFLIASLWEFVSPIR